MASVDIKLPEAWLKRLSTLGQRTDEIATKALEAGGEVVLEQVRNNLRNVIGKNTKYPSRSTGELVDALGLSPAKVDRDGNYNIKVGFREPRKGGGSNAMIANTIEHGKHGQPAKPFLKPAQRQSQKASLDAMTKTLEREIAKI